MKKTYQFHFLPYILLFILLTAVLSSGKSFGQAAPRKVNSAVVTVLMNTYTYPTAISAQGDYVVGVPFGGGASYFWSAGTGLIQFAGNINGVSDSGKGCGDFSNPSLQYNGNNVTTAGTWDPSTLQWTFPGMNPAVPALFSTDYNVGWDITSDGNTLVGMQWYANYDYSAFKWTQAGGYQMIGTGVGQGSRASGISANGTVVFGWAEFPSASRTPVIWYNSQVYYINNAQFGEAYGASTSGNYVTGEINGDGFRWSPQGTTIFSNTLNSGGISPTTVLNDGSVFGYTFTVPTSRRAFARDSLGILMTFNDYAEARGLENAQQWIFYSINDASSDGNKFIGAGKTPEGQAVTFIMEFLDEPAVFAISPQSVDFGQIPVGLQSGVQNLVIRNTGGGTLLINSVDKNGTNAAQFILQDNNSYPISLVHGDSAVVSVAFAPSSTGLKTASVDISASTGFYQVPLSGTGTSGVGLEEFDHKVVSVFPNPAGEFLRIFSSSALQNIKMVTLSGQLQYEKSCNGQSFLNIGVTSFNNGVYSLRCETEDGAVHFIPVIIQH